MRPGLGGADVAGRDLDQDLDLRGTRWKVLFRGSSCGWAGPPWGIPLMLPLPCPLPGCRDHVPFLYKCTHLGASPTCPAIPSFGNQECYRATNRQWSLTRQPGQGEVVGAWPALSPGSRL